MTEYWAQSGYKKAPRLIYDKLQKELGAARQDLNLLPAAKTAKIREMKDAARQDMNRALRWSREQKEGEVARLNAAVNPAPTFDGNVSAGVVAQREAAKNDLLRRFEKNPGRILSDYRDLLARGGGDLAPIYEEHAGEYLDTAQRREFNEVAGARRYAGMSDTQKQAHGELGKLLAEESTLELGWSHIDRNLNSVIATNDRPAPPDRHEEAAKRGIDTVSVDG